MISNHDLETYVQLGDALWANPVQSRRHLVDSLTASSLRESTDGRAVERAGAALLLCVERHGSAANARANGHRIAEPFYRLLPEERFLLIALHRGRWSYARLARILDEPVEQIEKLAWAARVSLAASARGTGQLPVSYPVGSQATPSCPQYEAERPWTQRFLDEEFEKSSQRLFLQNHLMACASCRETLRRSRDLYFAIESVLPQTEVAAQSGSFVEELRSLCRKSDLTRAPVERSFAESLGVFVQRPDIQWLIAGSVLLTLLIKMIHGWRH